MMKHNGKINSITNVSTGITQLSWNWDDSQLIFTGFYKSGYDIFTLSNPINKMELNINVPSAAWVDDIKSSKRLFTKK